MFTGHPFMLEHSTYVRSKVKKNSRKKRTRVEDCGTDRDRNGKDCELTVSYFVILFY